MGAGCSGGEVEDGAGGLLGVGAETGIADARVDAAVG